MIPKKNIKKKVLKKKYLKSQPFFSNLHVKSTYKNTLISLTKNNGNVLKQWSTKALKKTKFKKNTLYNIQLITRKINHYLQLKKIKKLNVHLNGYGVGRRNVLKNLTKTRKKKKGLKVGYIFETTKIPFNGCRPKKMKRR